MARKTGFLLANLHQGTSVRVWECISDSSFNYGDNAIFVLPGGRLGYKKADEYLRNFVYKFASSENLDGAVVWGSTLAGTATWKEAETFVKDLGKKIPVVSMGIRVEGVPSVDFDAYSGLYSMVEHMIRRHGARRIAYLRGPENHESAEERFQAYADALRDNGIQFDPKLVSSPMPWGEGEAAIREIVEKNGMVPKRDFNAMVCPSDLMNLKATRYLESKGFLVPDDIATAGFNDTSEVYLNSVESTTVRMPYKEMVETSFSLISDMEENNDGFFSDMSLPTVPVYRRSCGCTSPFGSEEAARKKIGNWEEYEKWITRRLSDNEASKVLISILHDLFEKENVVSSATCRYYGELIWRYLKHGGTMKLFFSVVKWTTILLDARKPSMEEMEILRDLIMEQSARVSVARKEFEKDMDRAFNSLGSDLLRSLSYREIGEAFCRNLPAMGLEKAFVFLTDGEGTSRLATGFAKGKIWGEGEEFPDSRIYPDYLAQEFESGLFILMPLFYDSSVVGYLVVENKFCSPQMIENIRNSTSATLQAISLYNIASIKSIKAEEAEKKSSQFYATLAEDLKEPLDAIKAMAGCGDLDGDILLALSTKAEHILQLSLSDKGELALEAMVVPGPVLKKEIEDRGIVVSSPAVIPSVFIDKGKVGEVLDYLAARARSAGDSLSIEILMEKRNLVLRTKGNVFDVSALSENDPSMLLCEKIMVMHGGTFRFGKASLDIVFPFPSISGAPSKGGGEKGILFISSKASSIPEGLGIDCEWMGYEDVVQKIAEIPSYSAIAWNMEDECKSANVALTVLQNHRETRTMPFISYGTKEGGTNFKSAVDEALLHSGDASVYSFGPFPKTLERLRDFGRVVEVDNPKNVPDEAKVALFVMQNADAAIIEGIKKRRAFSKTPLLVVMEKFSRDDAENLSPFPEVLMVNTSITESEDFMARVLSLIGGDELLPPLTSVLVKRAIAYLNENATRSVSRWQIAGSVNISEDYLTRIFRKEVGISPWDYLNRFRIQIASKLLLETGASISEIAGMTGFQDQAYFCRVFRKVKGFPPGNIRSRSQM